MSDCTCVFLLGLLKGLLVTYLCFNAETTPSEIFVFAEYLNSAGDSNVIPIANLNDLEWLLACCLLLLALTYVRGVGDYLCLLFKIPYVILPKINAI